MANDALIVIDVQSDFCKGGALAVPDADDVIAPINAMLPGYGLVVMTQDWHPPDHASFADNYENAQPFQTIDFPYGPQTLWPRHCVKGTTGATFHPRLRTHPATMILRKGTRRDVDSYSAFFENDRTTSTGLHGYLSDQGVTKLFLTGLATDFCVAHSALDAVRLGYTVILREKACRGIDLDGSLARAMSEMQAAGVRFA